MPDTITSRPSMQRMVAVLRGWPEERAPEEIRRAVFPWRTRCWLGVRGLASDRAGSAEEELPGNLAACTSSKEIEEVFFNYRTDPSRLPGLERRIFGQPRLKRALLFYGQLKDEWRARSLR